MACPDVSANTRTYIDSHSLSRSILIHKICHILAGISLAQVHSTQNPPYGPMISKTKADLIHTRAGGERKQKVIYSNIYSEKTKGVKNKKELVHVSVHIF